MSSSRDVGPPEPSDLGLDREPGADLLRVDTAEELLAAVPALLGFVPHRSLVITPVTVDATNHDRRQLVVVIRIDLDDITAPDSERLEVVEIGAALHRVDARALLCVVVDDRPTAERDAALALAWLCETGVAVRGAWLVPTVTTGAHYRDLLDPDRSGVLPDPATSLLAVTKVRRGSPVRGSREELLDLLTPDPVLTEQVTAHLDHATAFYRAASPGTCPEAQLAFHGATLRWVLDRITTLDRTGCTADDLVAITVVVRERVIRDAVVGLIGTTHGPPAARLWQMLTRATQGSDRARGGDVARARRLLPRRHRLGRNLFRHRPAHRPRQHAG